MNFYKYWCTVSVYYRSTTDVCPFLIRFIPVFDGCYKALERGLAAHTTE